MSGIRENHRRTDDPERPRTNAQRLRSIRRLTQQTLSNYVECSTIKLQAREVSLTYTDLLVKSRGKTLWENTRDSMQTLTDDGIHLLSEINIGVAVALEDGFGGCRSSEMQTRRDYQRFQRG